MNSLKEALKNRRGRSLDINIIVSGPGEEHSDQKTYLAPPGEDKEAEAMGEESEGMDIENQEMQDALMSGMGEHDKEHIQKPGNAKSLGQKARLAAMMNAKK